MEQVSGWKVEFAPGATTAERQLICEHFQQKIPDCLVIKKGHHRKVERVCQAGADIYAKTNFLHNFRAKLRRLFRPCKSKMEFKVLLELYHKGINSLIPLAWAEKSQSFGESILYTRTRDGSLTLEDYWQSSWNRTSNQEKSKVACNWASLMAQLHRNGLFHPDPHPGNILIIKESHELLVIDIHHPTRIRNPTIQHRKDDLAAWAMWANLRISIADLAMFLKYYVQITSIRDFKKCWTEISDLAASRQNRFWARHETNIIKGNHRRFAKIRSKGLSGHSLGTFIPAAIEIAQNLRLQSTFRDNLVTIKSSPSSKVYRTEWQGNGIIIKVIPWKTDLLSSLKRFLGFHPAKAQWFWANALRLRMLPTPKIFAWFMDHTTRQSIILTEDLVTAKQLDHWLEINCNNPNGIKAGVRDLARSVKTLHQRGVFNRDMKAANIMIDEKGDQYWVDLGGMGHLWVQKNARRMKDLARLAGSFWKNPHLTNQDRMRFLKTYLPRNEWNLKRYKTTWKLIDYHALERITSRKATGRPLG